MSGVKKVCWNCVYCDTFAGVCHKGKYTNVPLKIHLDHYSCEEFDDNLFTAMNLEIEQLKAENERLKQENDVKNVRITELFLTNEELFIENKQLKEALQKCSPFLATTGSRLEVCEFCFNKPHTDDCEYIKLCKT
jgi:hypothetical protein